MGSREHLGLHLHHVIPCLRELARASRLREHLGPHHHVISCLRVLVQVSRLRERFGLHLHSVILYLREFARVELSWPDLSSACLS